MANEFEEITPLVIESPGGTVGATAFLHQGVMYTICTTNITLLRFMQAKIDLEEGYTGPLGNFETMLFVGEDSQVYPFGDLPGHPRLGVFQRYETEEEARDGHQAFVTRVKRHLSLE